MYMVALLTFGLQSGILPLVFSAGITEFTGKAQGRYEGTVWQSEYGSSLSLGLP